MPTSLGNISTASTATDINRRCDYHCPRCLTSFGLHPPPQSAPARHDTERLLQRFHRYLVFILLLICFHIVAASPATAPMAAAFTSMGAAGDRLVEGFTILALIRVATLLYSLVRNAHTQLIGGPAATPTPTPAQLESGDAPTLHELMRRAEVNKTTMGKLVSLTLAINCLASIHYISEHDIVSIMFLKKPLLENLGAILLFILRGLEVVFISLLLIGTVAWLVWRGIRSAEAAPDPSIEAPFGEEGVAKEFPPSIEKESTEAAKKA